jgi:hypothetical protein
VAAHSGGNAKGRTEISRVATYFDRPINEAAQILGASRADARSRRSKLTRGRAQTSAPPSSKRSAAVTA